MLTPRSSLEHRTAGFTLIEVLVALVILAVGLMATASLGVSSAQSLGVGGRNSRAAATAAQYLDEGLGQLHRDVLPAQLCDTLASGAIVSRTITVNPNNPRLAYIGVTVVPEQRGSVPNRLTAGAHAFSPNGYAGPPSGSPCP